MPANYVLLERVTLTATTASAVFDNIPQTGYSDLKIVISGRGNGTSFSTQPWQNVSVTLNSTSNSAAKQLFGTAAGTGSDSQGSGVWITDPEATTNTFSNNEIYLANYLSSTAKTVAVDNITETNGTDAARVLWTAIYSSVTSAVTNITITPVSGSFLANSTFSLYGIAAFGTTPVIAPKATGGDIVISDGTYWYHAFLGSNLFTPNQALSCDVLTIAGGGGGSAGGGGAGGLVYSASNSLTATSYSVTVGAGGAGRGGDADGSQGTNSQFGALTAAIGGGYGAGGAAGTVNGGNGGSGGGAGAAQGSTLVTASGGTGSQGFNGGSLSSASRAGGGGGGAGQVGANGTTNTGGVGGNGLNTYSSWASATGTGADSGYYAGGGGGTSTSTTTKAGGLGGGGAGGGDSTTEGVPGTAGTGGGGGGSRTATGGRAGGSGIVIVRYTVA